MRGLGIEAGDIIEKVNDKIITSTYELTKIINETEESSIKVTYLREGEEKETRINKTKVADGTYKIGLWVRDTAAGVGIATFYDSNSKKFACLGHGIMDVDTGGLIDISSGDIVNANILSIVKGTEGNPRKNSRNYRRKRDYRNCI